MGLQSKKKLLWQCRRGMLELELFLNDFMEFNYDSLTEIQKKSFENLLTIIDPVLFDYLMGIQESDDRQQREIINIIRSANRNRC